jgi:hypothetical protein
MFRSAIFFGSITVASEYWIIARSAGDDEM